MRVQVTKLVDHFGQVTLLDMDLLQLILFSQMLGVKSEPGRLGLSTVQPPFDLTVTLSDGHSETQKVEDLDDNEEND